MYARYLPTSVAYEVTNTIFISVGTYLFQSLNSRMISIFKFPLGTASHAWLTQRTVRNWYKLCSKDLKQLFSFSRQDFSVVLEPVLELAL